ncbi:uncharacterized protein CC84DRAFT_1136658 [Paraphaeosphaeria sporulosa]|uniref:Initiator tRNA phosphoribosyl transferase n=1 Tax=Paraphaeosphaeria sporulosa TaxID=1460663 RepID=A0A177CQI3_9PLEO|nr:uncharacterized protein CC84DRAFT_1136658 [Paraphaeosphaeria sporulosa]OAG09208.1 hypothetical protein CC84DRAFT_1136658 [Paraphaeosphaeria sporulosa]
MSRPLNESDLIFPTQSLSISGTLNSLKRSALSTHNRLSSIQFDANFVASVSESYGLPLVANERCGSWYIPPARKAESVYFKSTDGHTNEWKFSVRRLNLQLLDLVGREGGCVIVDSTRRGKSMPDALSKTVPVWCCVMNRVLFSEEGVHELHTAPQAVSQSEHAQIERRIDGFVREFLDICKPDVELLRSTIGKAMRPIWVTQTSSIPETPPIFPDFHPIVLCTASRRVNGAEGSEGGYIQGAADDHEAWSQGLTPTLFWSHGEQLLNTNEEDLPDLIKRLVEGEATSDAAPILIKPTSNLYISTTQNLNTTPFDVVVSCGPEPLPGLTSGSKTRYLHLKCQTGKLGSRDLRTQLKRLPILETWLPPEPTTIDKKILICDPTGKDLAVGTALAILCTYADASGALTFVPNTHARIDKKTIKQRLAWLATTHPTLNPPRATLQSVNAWLMPNPSEAAAYASPSPPNTSAPPSKLTAASLFTALHASSPWTFTRTLTSALPTHPSGTVTGTATFTPLPSSRPALLYAEEGEFTTTTGMTFTTRMKYVYVLRGELDERLERVPEAEWIAVHFWAEKAGDEEADADGVGGLFVEMALQEGAEVAGEVARIRNREQHLCGRDLYAAIWEVPVGGDGVGWWKVRYDVKGPKKEYVSETRYSAGTGV